MSIALCSTAQNLLILTEAFSSNARSDMGYSSFEFLFKHDKKCSPPPKKKKLFQKLAKIENSILSPKQNFEQKIWAKKLKTCDFIAFPPPFFFSYFESLWGLLKHNKKMYIRQNYSKSFLEYIEQIQF